MSLVRQRRHLHADDLPLLHAPLLIEGRQVVVDEHGHDLRLVDLGLAMKQGTRRWHFPPTLGHTGVPCSIQGAPHKWVASIWAQAHDARRLTAFTYRASKERWRGAMSADSVERKATLPRRMSLAILRI